MKFCEEYLVDCNATQAAIGAGYAERSASSMGYENRQKPKIQRYISELKEARNLRTQVTADRVLVELAKITFAEKGVKTGYKLKALDMLAKHVGIFDNQPNLELRAKMKNRYKDDKDASKVIKDIKKWQTARNGSDTGDNGDYQ
ncbi:MAG: terminase small subunit [Planctomycetes bacterium]|nr:terminase small subunit [Planctomycetota bacterium]